MADKRILARDVVRYQGEPVAAVAAETEAIAAEACELIEVEYEPLPAVFDVEEALERRRAAGPPRPRHATTG